MLQKLKDCPFVPKYIGLGHIRSLGITFLITEFLGPTLQDLFEICGRRFSLKTTCMIFHQLIEGIRDFHNYSFVHRDIKPDNFMFGYKEKTNKMHLIDFGLANKYFDNVAGHIPFQQKTSLTGNARFASTNAHKGYELSRRDDMQSISHMMIYLWLG